MRIATLQLELLDEIVMSESSATAGGHRCLEYIPGASMLGWAAKMLYAGLSQRDAFTVFHSGDVRFGSALPMSADGESTWPMPLCWHEDKGGESAEKDNRLHSDRLINLMHVQDMEAIGQPRQLRGGFVTPSGNVVRPLKHYRMKTAIDPAEGRAAGGQLFGYESLARGGCFMAELKAEDNVSDLIWKQLLDTLSGTIRLGRSRSAQYGRVSCTVTEGWAHDGLSDLEGSRELTLWLKSDLVVRSTNGVPTLIPEPQSLGLPKGALLRDKSFVRFRRYSPYNGARRGYDLERQAIVAGSVLRYALDEPLQADHVRRIVSGLGEYREAGLGSVIANANLLKGPRPNFAAMPSPMNMAPVARPNHPLVAWLEVRQHTVRGEEKSLSWAENKVKELVAVYASARRFNGIPADQECGPNATQWARVEEAAKGSTHADVLRKHLFDPRDGVCKPNDEAWGVATGMADKANFVAWLEAALKEANACDDVGRRITLLADQAQKMAQRGQFKKGA